MNVVDNLVVTLGLDSSSFKQGQVQTQASLKRVRDDAAVTAKDLQAEGKKAAEFFGAIRNEALSLIGVLVGASGLKAFIGDQTKSLAQAGKDARSIGESVPGVVAFANAMRLLGGTTQGATGMLQSFASLQANAKLFGDPAFVQEMGLIGGNLDTKPQDAAELFQAYIEKHRNEPGGIQNIEAIAAKLFPSIDRPTLQAMEQAGTVANLNKALAESYKLGAPTPEMSERATKFQRALAALGVAAEYDGDVMLNSMYPGLTAVTHALADFITQSPAALAALATIGGSVAALTTLGAVRISAQAMGLTGLATVLEGIALLAGRLGLIGVAAATAYEALHASGLNEGEEKTPGYAGRFGASPGGSATGGTAGPFGPSGNPGAPLAPDVEAEVRRQAAQWGLDPDHMVRLAQKEQGGYNKVSPAGAFGPMQLMPGTASDVGVKQSDPWQKNVWGGMYYYHTLLDKFGHNYAAADAAYNAGYANPGVKRFAATGDPSGLPAETKDYVNTINRAGKVAGLPNRIAPPPPRLPPPAPANTNAPPSSNTTTVSIGNINLPNVRDAKGFARDVSGALVAQANRGPQ